VCLHQPSCHSHTLPHKRSCIGHIKASDTCIRHVASDTCMQQIHQCIKHMHASDTSGHQAHTLHIDTCMHKTHASGTCVGHRHMHASDTSIRHQLRQCRVSSMHHMILHTMGGVHMCVCVFCAVQEQSSHLRGDKPQALKAIFGHNDTCTTTSTVKT